MRLMILSQFLDVRTFSRNWPLVDVIPEWNQLSLCIFVGFSIIWQAANSIGIQHIFIFYIYLTGHNRYKRQTCLSFHTNTSTHTLH